MKIELPVNKGKCERKKGYVKEGKKEIKIPLVTE